MKNNKSITRENVLKEIDFHELSKNCKTQDDLSELTKEFMKNMIENIIIDEYDLNIPKREFKTYDPTIAKYLI